MGSATGGWVGSVPHTKRKLRGHHILYPSRPNHNCSLVTVASAAPKRNLHLMHACILQALEPIYFTIYQNAAVTEACRKDAIVFA